MRYESREWMGGLCAEEKTCSRDPSWLQIARSMYHKDFNVVKGIFRVQGNWLPVDKATALPYSVPDAFGKGRADAAAHAARPLYLHGIIVSVQPEPRCPVLHHADPGAAATGRAPRLQRRRALGGPQGVCAPASVVPRVDPAYRRHHCVHYRFRPAFAGQGTRGDAGGRVEPPAARAAGHALRPPGLRSHHMACAVGPAVELDQSQEGGAEPVTRPARPGPGTGVFHRTDPEHDDLRLGEGG